MIHFTGLGNIQQWVFPNLFLIQCVMNENNYKQMTVFIICVLVFIVLLCISPFYTLGIFGLLVLLVSILFH